ncbi:protein SCO1/2 [Breoghania corrubedonensis]|uniref:Protein SCO1/2 n=1 Tax=Breoghania corrubedonensis TaxID=665038 RepID=A0A2T5VEI8_9HYPH|nr:SCO family protein [Breoghania corrubedonensis]PTW62174.1 protein SCO1/2 [Breoghania corrubedonensis]
MSAGKIIRYGAWAAVAALVLVVGGIAAWSYLGKGDGKSLIAPVATIGGPFTLENGKGETVTEADLKDKPTVMFFGYTFCPDVCPTTLAELQGWIEQLGPDADKLHYVFVTVDPERDTPDVMASYVAAFDDHIMPLTGTREQVDKMIKAYRVYARKVPLDDGGYAMDHSAGLYLFNANGHFVGTIAYGEDTDVAMQKLKRLITKAES